MLREINKITTDTYIPFAFHFGTNYGEVPGKDDLAKECFRVVIYRNNQNPDNGYIMTINKVTRIWLHTISTSTSSMNVVCTCMLDIDQEMPYDPNDMYYNVCVDIDIINIFKKLVVFTDYNKYNIDPIILWEKINVADGLSYRIYDTSLVRVTLFNRNKYDSDNQQWTLYDTPPYRIKSAGITVDSHNIGRVICPVNPTKLYQVSISFNTNMALMSDVFSIKNLDLLKKNLKTNLKTKHIISPSKYNKINLGGEFDMLRNVYKRDYIAYSEYFGFNDGLSKTDANQFTTLIVNYTFGTSKVLDVKTKINYIWCHLSVINENTLGFIISAELFTESNDYVLPDYIIDGLTEITINIADIYQFSKSGIFSIINSDNYDGYKILQLSSKDNYGYSYTTVNTTFYTSTSNGDNSFDTAIIPMNIAILDGSIKINADNLKLIKLNYNYINSYHIERIKVYGNINLQFKQPSFSMKYTNSLKKNFRVYYLNNIEHLQNYYIN